MGIVSPPKDLDSDERFEWMVERHQGLEVPVEEFFKHRADWMRHLNEIKQTGRVAPSDALTVYQPKGWRFYDNPMGTMPRERAVVPVGQAETNLPPHSNVSPYESIRSSDQQGFVNPPAPKPKTEEKVAQKQIKKPGKYRSLTRAIASKVPALKAPAGRVGLAIYLFALLLLLIILLVKVKTGDGSTATRWQIAGSVISGKAAIT